ncbi:5791_t:CDS:2, partial [Racocetra fulgida]
MGNINDWDVYWTAQPQRVLLNKCNSHSALSEELKILKKIFDPTNPADKIICNIQNELKERINQISSLKVVSDIVDLKLEIDQKEGRRDVHQITQEGLKVAQKGIQNYSEAEFDTQTCISAFQFTEARPQTPTNKNYQEIQNDNDSYNITNGTDDYLRKAVESMAGQVESDALIVDDVNLEEIFENYRNE